MLDRELLKNPEKLYNYSPKEAFARLYVLEKVLTHLNENKNDRRKKERMRIRIALAHIYEWMKIGEDVYDKSHSN